MQSSEYEDESFVIINDFSDYDNELWQCPNCGEVSKIDDIVNARKRRQRPEASFHSEEQQQEVVVNESPSSYSPSNNGERNPAQTPSPPLGSESILPPHIILRYAHRRAVASRSVSDFYKVLSEFYGIPVPVVETLPTLGHEKGRKILGSCRENKIRFAASPTLHTILHVYFHYYSSFFVDDGGKNTTTRSQKSTSCKTVCDPTKEERQANDYANKCVIAFEQDFDYKQEFRHLALKYHPDRGGSPRIFELVKTAYDFLVDPSTSLPEAYSPSNNTRDRQRQQQAEHSSSGPSSSPNSQGKSHNVSDIGLTVLHLTSFIVGIFGSILLNLVSVLLLPWNYWRKRKSRSSSFSFITKWLGTKRTTMFLIQSSILLADGLIIALLIQGVLIAYSFPQQSSGYVTLQIFGALIGATTLVIGICKTLFR